MSPVFSKLKGKFRRSAKASAPQPGIYLSADNGTTGATTHTSTLGASVVASTLGAIVAANALGATVAASTLRASAATSTLGASFAASTLGTSITASILGTSIAASTLRAIATASPFSSSSPRTNRRVVQHFPADTASTLTHGTDPETAAPSIRGTSWLWEKAVEKFRKQGHQDFNWGEEFDIQLVPKLIGEIEQKKRECDEKRWFYKNKQGEKVFYVETLLGQLDKYALVGDIAIQHHPEIVALVWSGFRLLLQAGTAYTGNMQAVSEGLEYLVRTLCYCDIYERLYSSRELEVAEQLNTSIVDLYVSILEYLCHARGYIQKNTTGRVLASFFSELGGLLSKVRSLDIVVEESAGVADREAAAAGRFEQADGMERLKELLSKIKEPIEEVKRVCKELFTYVQGERRSEILQWLSDVQYKDHHSYSSERRHSDTGNWLLENEKYSGWRLLDSSSIFWLGGDAGSGKTILASRVIDEFFDQAKGNNHVIAYFYCEYSEEKGKRNDPESVMRALVKQFCLANPAGELLPEPVLSIYEKREADGHACGPLKLEESTDLIINLSEGFTDTTIIIDALDECYLNTRVLVDALTHIVSSTNCVKIFVTSRNGSDIPGALAGFPSHYISATDNTQDINKYIELEIERRRSTRSLRYGEKPLIKGKALDSRLENKIISTLQNKADGMFMWVQWQIAAICDEKTPGGVEKALDMLPNGLGETYTKILRRISGQSDTDSSTAKKILKWLLYAQEPCSPDTTIQALAVKSGAGDLDTNELEWTLSDILTICQNLIVYDEKLGNLRFAHLSVQEFLQSQPEFSQKENAHSDMAEICLTVLTNHYSETQSCSAHSLLDYSIFNWAAHVRLSGAGCSNFERLWKDFLGPLLPTPAYNAWGLKVTVRDRNLQGEGSQVVSPLWAACYYQLYDISMFLLDNGADPNSRNRYKKTPLLRAVQDGHQEIIRMLLEKDGVGVNYQDEDGWTPLSLAAMRGHDETVRMLLEKGEVDVNSMDDFGLTPLIWAVKYGHEKVVQLLLENYGVDVNLADRVGTQKHQSRTPGDGNKKTFQTLQSEEPLSWAVGDGGRNPLQTLQSKTPLSWAVGEGHEEVVRMLLKKDKVDVNCKDKDSQTPLSFAARNCHQEIVRMLLGKDGVDINCEDKDGRTPLSYAARNHHQEIVQMLLEKDGVDANYKDENGWTPLFFAAEGGHQETVRRLLEKYGVNVNCKDKDGQTPLSLAVKNNHEEIVQMLLENGGVALGP